MAMPDRYSPTPTKFVLRMNFDYVNADEICRALRKFTDAVDRTERMVGSKWPGHMAHTIFDRHGAKVGAWQITN